MQSKTITIECNAIIQQFNLALNIDQHNLQSILQAVFQLQNTSIVGLIDQDNNIYDLDTFCNNIHKFKIQQFSLLLSSQKPEKNSLNFSKDRGQSQQGKRQRGNYHQNSRSSIPATENSARNQNFIQKDDSQGRLQNRSHSIISILPEQVKYFEDFEFFVKSEQHENPNQYYLIWFFDFKEKMKSYNFQQNNQFFNTFPQIEQYTGLYPSFRSAPFGQLEDTFCLSFFRGDQMIFERDISLNKKVPQAIIDLIEEHLLNSSQSHHFNQHSNSSHNNISTPRQQKQNQNQKLLFTRSGSGHSQNLLGQTQIHSQDAIFETLEILSQHAIRSKFSDQENKDLIKLARKQHKGLLTVLEEYIDKGDEDQMFQNIKIVLQNVESNLDVSFDKDDSNNFIPTKAQSQSENIFTHTVITSMGTIQNNKQLQQQQRKNNNNNLTSQNQNAAYNQQQQNYHPDQQQQQSEASHFSFLIQKEKYNSQFALKQYLREKDIKQQFSLEQKAFLIFVLSEQKASTENILQQLQQEDSLRQQRGIQKLRKVADDFAEQTYEKYFPSNVIQIIQQLKNDRFSFVSGALCTLFSFANIEKFRSIIIENYENLTQNNQQQIVEVISPIQKAEEIQYIPDYINVQQSYVPEQQQQQQQKINTQSSNYKENPNFTDDKQQEQQQQVQDSKDIPFPTVNSLFSKNKTYASQQQQPSEQSDSQQYMSQQPQLYGGGESPPINQIQMFGNYSPPNHNTSELVRLLQNTSSQNMRGSNSFDHTHKEGGNINSNNSPSNMHSLMAPKEKVRKGSMMSQRIEQLGQEVPEYSAIARERQRERKPTFQLTKEKSSMSPTKSPVKRPSIDQKQSLQLVRLVDQQMNQLIDRYNVGMNQENYDQTYKKAFQKCYDTLRFEQQKILSEFYKTRLPPLIQFLDNVNICEAYLQENIDSLYKIIETHVHLTKEEDYEFPSQFEISPSIRVRVTKYKTFKKVLKYLYEVEKYISHQQFHFFHYLYIKDNIQTLASFEVYLLTRDISDFVENLAQIMKYQFFKKEFNYDEIECFDLNVEQQLGILFTFKKELNKNERQTLEKTVKMRDNTIQTLYNKYKSSGNREKFLGDLHKFADFREKEFKAIEDKQLLEEEDDELENNKYTIEKFQNSKLIKEVGRIQFLLDLLDAHDERIEGIFQVYDLTKDKGEFVESLTLLYKYIFKQKLVQTVEQLNINETYDLNKIEKLYKEIQNSHSVIFGAFEFYLDNSDLDEFKDSVCRILDVL